MKVPGLSKPALQRMLGFFLALFATITCTYLVPALQPFRPWVPSGSYVPFWNLVGRELLGEGKAMEAEAAEMRGLREKAEHSARSAEEPANLRPKSSVPIPVFPPLPEEKKQEPPSHYIEHSSALDHFYRKLTLVDLGIEDSIARASHWGDSVLGMDGITSEIRRRLQSRFGDAGHGFHLLDRYNPSYRQQGIEFEPGGGWSRCLVVSGCRRKENHFGYGGLIVQGNRGAAASFATTEEGFGGIASRFELWFARMENGGEFEIVVDGKDTVVVDTRGPELEDAWHEVRVEPGSHSFQVRAAGSGEVRGYGVVLENDGPGVVWDGMALIGGSTRGLRTQDPKHIENQVRRRDTDLLVFMFGGNDMQRNYVDLKESMEPYFEEFGDVIEHFRAGKPEASCLIMSVLDHGKRSGDHIASIPFAGELARAQGEVARRNGCAFFDTYEATGGEGTAARWYRSKPRLISADLGHPNPLGHKVIADLVVDAILYGYQEYREQNEGKPLEELAQ